MIYSRELILMINLPSECAKKHFNICGSALKPSLGQKKLGRRALWRRLLEAKPQQSQTEGARCLVSPRPSLHIWFSDGGSQNKT